MKPVYVNGVVPDPKGNYVKSCILNRTESFYISTGNDGVNIERDMPSIYCMCIAQAMGCGILYRVKSPTPTGLHASDSLDPSGEFKIPKKWHHEGGCDCHVFDNCISRFLCNKQNCKEEYKRYQFFPWQGSTRILST
jgi:hypothetical protein